MKRSWNWLLWGGFILVLAALFSYSFFIRFPVTRDFPWVNLLLFCVGGVALAIGLGRAFGRPGVYRGKIFGPILAVLALLAISFFCYGVFYFVRQLPASAAAPRVGDKAPAFALPDQDGKTIALSDVLSTPDTRAVLLIFYRGYW
jgi:hypothetical protein